MAKTYGSIVSVSNIYDTYELPESDALFSTFEWLILLAASRGRLPRLRVTDSVRNT